MLINDIDHRILLDSKYKLMAFSEKRSVPSYYFIIIEDLPSGLIGFE